jgi:hypothetical protein
MNPVNPPGLRGSASAPDLRSRASEDTPAPSTPAHTDAALQRSSSDLGARPRGAPAAGPAAPHSVISALQGAREVTTLLAGIQGGMRQLPRGEANHFATALQWVRGTSMPADAARALADLGPDKIKAFSAVCLAQLEGHAPAHAGAQADAPLKGLRYTLEGVRQHAASLRPEQRRALRSEFSAALPEIGSHLQKMKILLDGGLRQAKQAEAEQGREWGLKVEELTTRMNGGASIGNGQPWTMASASQSAEMKRVLSDAPPSDRAQFSVLLDQHCDEINHSMNNQRLLTDTQLSASGCELAHAHLAATLDNNGALNNIKGWLRGLF